MSSKKIIQKVIYGLLFAVIGWFILCFIIIPVVGVVREIFFKDGSFSFDVIKKLTSSGRVLSSLKNTYIMAACTIVTVSVVGIFQIMVTEYFKVRGSKFLDIIFHSPLIYGGISLVTGYNYIYSSNGFVTKMLLEVFPNMNSKWFTGFMGVLFVHSFSMTTYHILFVKTSFKRVDYSTIEACRSLGGSNVRAFFSVALPVIKPAIFSATVLLTLMALNSFAAPSVLGGKDFYMINSMILNLNSIGSRELAALLAFVLAITCIILLLVLKWFERRNNYVSVSKVPTKIRKMKIRNPILNVLVHAVAYALGIIYVLPILGILIFSFADIQTIVDQTFPTHFTLENYIRVFSQSTTLKPLLNSMKLSVLAVIIVMFICIASALAIHKKKSKVTLILELTLLIPWMLPATMLVVGMISTYSTANPLVFNVVLLGGFWLLPIAYAVTSIPSAMRLIKASLYNVNTAHEEAARSLGAGPIYTLLRVILPAMLPTAISVAAITFNGLLSEYTVSALLYSANNVPLGIVLRTPATNPDPFSAASTLVYIVILMGLSSVTLGLTQKYRSY
ncbi:MAG: iron ABC transporter permease [Lachnospiraceae bacterium]|nr:iron ABC transporter permease [Lachnospiraceae bacterium]